MSYQKRSSKARNRRFSLSPAEGPARPTRGEAVPRQGSLRVRARSLIRAVREQDEATIEQTLIGLSRSRRYLAPLSMLAGAVIILVQGLRLVFTNWRLFLLQVLPAMWVWAAMLNLKLHLFRGRTFKLWYGGTAITLMSVIVVITVAVYYLNAVFAFAIASPQSKQIRIAFLKAGKHRAAILTVGVAVGIPLAVSTIVVPRWGLFWFSLALSIVVGVMMLSYVAFPARLIGMTTNAPRKDKIAATVLSGAVGAVICTPAYVLGRVGVLLLGSSHVAAVGIVLLCLAFCLQGGATGAINAVKMSVKLVINR